MFYWIVSNDDDLTIHSWTVNSEAAHRTARQLSASGRWHVVVMDHSPAKGQMNVQRKDLASRIEQSNTSLSWMPRGRH